MSKFVNVPNGDYKVTVQSGGQITLDTGIETGRVVITGDLIVEGNTTTVKSEDLTVTDNIIVVNSGETGPGITKDEAGLRVDRGNFVDTFFVFKEDPFSDSGSFVFRDFNNSLVGITTNSISTGGGDLFLINSGTGTVSVTGTSDYELNVTDDDDITNKKYVDDAITTAFATIFLKQIGDGSIAPSNIIVEDNETTGTPSRFDFKIDTQTIAQVYGDRWEFEEIRIAGTKIETMSSNEDLILSAPGTGKVTIDDVLHINSMPGIDDTALQAEIPSEGISLYVSDQSTGKTGIYFANSNENRDELISKNRALLFGMLF